VLRFFFALSHTRRDARPCVSTITTCFQNVIRFFLTPKSQPLSPSGLSPAPFAFGIFPKRGKEKEKSFWKEKGKEFFKTTSVADDYLLEIQLYYLIFNLPRFFTGNVFIFEKIFLPLHRFWCPILFSRKRIKGNSVQIRNSTRCCKFYSITNYELRIEFRRNNTFATGTKKQLRLDLEKFVIRNF
jgi:hypothetical protein